MLFLPKPTSDQFKNFDNNFHTNPLPFNDFDIPVNSKVSRHKYQIEWIASVVCLRIWLKMANLFQGTSKNHERSAQILLRGLANQRRNHVEAVRLLFGYEFRDWNRSLCEITCNSRQGKNILCLVRGRGVCRLIYIHRHFKYSRWTRISVDSELNTYKNVNVDGMVKANLPGSTHGDEICYLFR